MAGICSGVGLLSGLCIQMQPLTGLYNHLWLSKVTEYVLWQDTASGWIL